MSCMSMYPMRFFKKKVLGRFLPLLPVSPPVGLRLILYGFLARMGAVFALQRRVHLQGLMRDVAGYPKTYFREEVRT